jgi:DNA-binding NarL/FixJ family response regulator
MIRIAIVEDNAELSAGLTFILSSVKNFSCKVFNTAESALGSISDKDYDVVLMDIKLPGMSGIECTQILKQKYPALKIMMCTIFEENEKIYRAIAAGASGYILKRTEPQLLIQSINELMDGGAPISGAIAQKVLSAFRELMPKTSLESPLSEREQEILNLLAIGCSNKAVAERLSVSIATVKTHVYNIYQKLHVNSRVDAINRFKNQPKG